LRVNFSGMKKDVWLVVLGLVGGLFGAGVLFLVSRPAIGTAVQLLPAPTPLPLVVYVTGEVINPGLFNLPPGSRLVDAIEAAGGMTDQAASQAINLAQMVTDGMRINIPDQNAVSQDDLTMDISRAGEPVAILVNINTADQAELETLPEIGPVSAQEIIAYRQVNGPFESIDEIMDVPGIGNITFEAIRELITVDDQP